MQNSGGDDFAEKTLNVLWQRRGGNIEVFGSLSEQEISHASAHQRSLETALLQPREDLPHGRRNLGACEDGWN
jgi:hypothetical protein